MIKKLWGNKIVRFASIGVINTLTDLLLLNILVFAFGLKFIYANLISASISISLSYFWNHFLVFKQQNPVSLKLFIRFFIITGFGILIIQTGVIYVLGHIIKPSDVASHLNISYSLAKVISVNVAKIIAVVFSMIWNFVLYNLAVFKDDKDEEGVVPY